MIGLTGQLNKFLIMNRRQATSYKILRNHGL